MFRCFFVLALFLAAFSIAAQAQDPDYQYPFDGSVQNVSSNPAFTGSYGAFAYGSDRDGKADASIYFTGGTVFSYPQQMPTNQISVCFWYKTATDGVVLPAQPVKYIILGAVDTNVFAAPWSVSITRSSSTADEFCLVVATSQAGVSGCFETDASWNHIAMVWDNSGATSSLKGYLNGLQVVDLSNLSRNTILNPDMLVVANKDTLSLLDDLRIYNRILSDAEIATLGEGGGPNSVAEHSTLRNMGFYPNPTADVITLEIPEDAVVTEIEIRDQVGRVVRREQATSTISLATLSNGRYSVTALNNGKIVGVSTVVVLH